MSGFPSEQKKRTVRITEPARKVTQSGSFGRGGGWTLTWDTQERWENVTMGWASTADPLSNLVVDFDSVESAKVSSCFFAAHIALALSLSALPNTINIVTWSTGILREEWLELLRASAAEKEDGSGREIVRPQLLLGYTAPHQHKVI